MRETVKSETEKTLRIQFIPNTVEEKKYLSRLKKIFLQKRRGDWEMVAEEVGIPTRSAEKAFIRVYSKNHFEVVDALEKIIQERTEKLKS